MLELIFITSLKIIFMYGAMQEGEIFGPDSKIFPLRRWLEWSTSWLSPDWQHYVRKPLFDCMFCMSSVWGITFLFLQLPFWLDVIFCIAGLNYLWSALVGYLHEAKDAAEEKQNDAEKRLSDLESMVWPLGKYGDDR